MSNAERQKKYRERKKAEEGENYLRKEVQRVKKYYVPTSELSKKIAIEKTQKNKRKHAKTSTESKRGHICAADSDGFQ